MSRTKKSKAPLIIVIILLLIIVVVPLALVGSSFIGRVSPDSVIPDSFDVYASVPEPLRLGAHLLSHEALPDILALAELAPVTPLLNQIRGTGLAENKLVREAAKGRLDAAILSGDRILAAWDAGIVSPVFKILPLLAGRITMPGLYYVKAGKNSRFEYRMDDGSVFFIGPYKNLLIISNNSALYESVIAGTSRQGDMFGSTAKSYYSDDYDIAFLISPPALVDMLFSGEGEEQSGDLGSAIGLLQFSGPIEASLSIQPEQLKFRIVSPISSGSQALQRIIERNSRAAPLEAMIPANAQYLTLFSAGSLQELLGAATAIAAGTPGGADWDNNLRRADSSARIALGMNLEELLYSWSGDQFAIYGLEGRPNPIIAIEVRDERKRREVFDKAFRSIFITENIQLNLDGNRIPRIQLPPFLNALLQFMGINVPSPYYTVQNNYLFISESAETLLAAVNSVRRNEVLPATDLWRTLSEDNSGPSSFSIFYSLDRSLPFFLQGTGTLTSILRLYRQGLARLHLEDRMLSVNLQVIPGAGKGIVPVTGYPVDMSGGAGRGRLGNRLYSVSSGRDTRLLLTRGSDVLAVNPMDRSVKEMTFPASQGTGVYVIPAAAEGAPSGNLSADAAAWVVNSQGHVSLVNKDLQNLRGFPISTGISLSAPPEAWGGRLYLSDENGAIHTVDGRASVNRWGHPFSSALRSPPFFIDFNNRTYAAVYPKSFFGEIYLLDVSGNPLPNWPQYAPGIAFGSPLLFGAQYAGSPARLFAAFITQAGELALYTETGEILPGFPVELEGVFYLQPVFDGERLWIIESEGNLYSVSLDGEIRRERIPRLSVKEEGYITTVETGMTGAKEIFFSGEGNALYGYGSDFSAMEGFPLPVWGKPVFGDLNGDGRTEAAGIGMDNRLYMWQFR